jgi:excisionase family DNA binding protein
MKPDIYTIAADIAFIKATLENNKRVLTFEEGCKYVGFAPSYMYKLTSSGIIPFSKPNGKTIFFDREKLDQWLLSNTTSTEEEKESQASTYTTRVSN